MLPHEKLKHLSGKNESVKQALSFGIIKSLYARSSPLITIVAVPLGMSRV